MKKLKALILMISLLALMTGSAIAAVQLSADGQSVIVPTQTFRAWQADLDELQILREKDAAMASIVAKLEAQVFAFQTAIEQERRAADTLTSSLRLDVEKQKRKAKTPGLGIAFGWSSADQWAAVAGIVWKIEGLLPW